MRVMPPAALRSTCHSQYSSCCRSNSAIEAPDGRLTRPRSRSVSAAARARALPVGSASALNHCQIERGKPFQGIGRLAGG